MKPGNLGLVRLVVAVAIFAAFRGVAEDAKPNPYETIAERNPFGLKPPPPPPDPNATAPAPAAPLATVEVTGILNLRSSKRVLLEIVPGPGKQPIKPMLGEGERVDAIEVVSIDVENGEVTINNGGVVTNVALKVASKSGGAPATAAVPGFPAQPGVNNPFAQPNVNTIYGGAAANANPSGRGVTVVGGTSAAVPNAAGNVYGGAQPVNFGNPGAYTAAQPAGLNPGINPLVSGGSINADGSRNIPVRPLRPTPQTTAQPQGGSVDPAVQYINMAVQKQQAEARGKPFPPLPPIPGLDQ